MSLFIVRLLWKCYTRYSPALIYGLRIHINPISAGSVGGRFAARCLCTGAPRGAVAAWRGSPASVPVPVRADGAGCGGGAVRAVERWLGAGVCSRLAGLCCRSGVLLRRLGAGVGAVGGTAE